LNPLPIYTGFCTNALREIQRFVPPTPTSEKEKRLPILAGAISSQAG